MSAERIPPPPPSGQLISYNVNTLVFGDHYETADIYRPRFERVILE